MKDLHLPRDFKPTHETGGLPGFPAIDVFGPARSFVTAPEDGELVWPHLIEWDLHKRIGGWTLYFIADAGRDTPKQRTYFLTHFGNLRDRGHYHHGGVLGTVAAVPQGAWEPHIHEGLHVGVYRPPHT